MCRTKFGEELQLFRAVYALISPNRQFPVASSAEDLAALHRAPRLH